MARHQVYSESTAGGDRVWLGTIGQVTGLQWSWSWPGGPEKASFKFWRDARFDHRALTQGRTVGICVGAGKHVSGVLSRPGRGNPWEVEVDGLAVVGDNYVADATDPFACNAVVDNAISRGLPWTRTVSLPTGVGDRSSSGGDAQRLSVAATLSKVLPESNQTWHVEPDGGAIVVDTLPTTPTHLFLTADPARGRTVGDYVSAYLVVYNSKTTGAVETVWVRSAASEAVRPPVEEILDLTGRGHMTTTQAQLIGAARLGIKGQRAPFADSFTFARGMVRNLYGTVVDVASLRLPMMARLMLTDPDRPTETAYGPATDFLVRRITYFDDTDTVEVEPLDLRKTDLKSLLGSASAPTADSSGSGSGGRRHYGPHLEMTNSAAQTTTFGSNLVLAFDTDTVNTDGTAMHNTASSNTDVNIPTDGVYGIKLAVEFASNATGYRQVNIFSATLGNIAVEDKNAVNGVTTKVNVYVEEGLNAGDTVSFGALPGGGAGAGPSVTATSYSPKVTVTWLRPLP